MKVFEKDTVLSKYNFIKAIMIIWANAAKMLNVYGIKLQYWYFHSHDYCMLYIQVRLLKWRYTWRIFSSLKCWKYTLLHFNTYLDLLFSRKLHISTLLKLHLDWSRDNIFLSTKMETTDWDIQDDKNKNTYRISKSNNEWLVLGNY